MTAARLGVGIVGAGPVAQAIHLPTLARMSDHFEIVNVMDVSEDAASAVAARAGARASTSLEELLADEDVEIVVICSPPQFHAQQVIAAMEAGKKGILCEKPFATDPEEARRITEAAERYGVPVVVGAMHVFDPGWEAAKREWEKLATAAHTVRSRIVLPFNDRFEDWATEILNRPEMNMSGGGGDPVAVAQAMLTGAVLGLTVHDLPLIRSLLPDAAALTVESARTIPPFGYAISGRVGERAVELVGQMHGHWEACWELEAIADDVALTVRFTPSYVHAGSAVATFEYADGSSRVFGPYAHNGYEQEWHALYAIVNGDRDAAPSPSSFLDDLAFTLAVAEKASAAAAKEFAS